MWTHVIYRFMLKLFLASLMTVYMLGGRDLFNLFYMTTQRNSTIPARNFQSHRANVITSDDEDDCQIVDVTEPSRAPVAMHSKDADSLDPALRAFGVRPVTDYRLPLPIKDDPDAEGPDATVDVTSTTPGRRPPASKKNILSHDIHGTVLQRMVS